MTVLLVTAGRDFCEAVTTKGEPRDRDLYMDERRSLGFALDFIAPARVIVGDAPGGDRWTVIWCEKRGVEFTRVTADWDKLGKRAGPERNQRMVDMRPDAGLRFPGGDGTRDCAHRCSVANIPIYEVKINDKSKD